MPKKLYYVVVRRHKDTKDVRELQSFFDTEKEAVADAALWNDGEEHPASEYAVYVLTERD